MAVAYPAPIYMYVVQLPHAEKSHINKFITSLPTLDRCKMNFGDHLLEDGDIVEGEGRSGVEEHKKSSMTSSISLSALAGEGGSGR